MQRHYMKMWVNVELCTSECSHKRSGSIIGRGVIHEARKKSNYAPRSCGCGHFNFLWGGGIGVIPLHKTNRKGKPVFQDLPLCYAFRLLVGRCILHLRYPKGCVGNHFRPQQPIVYYVITMVIIPYFFTFVKFAMLLNSKRL